MLEPGWREPGWIWRARLSSDEEGWRTRNPWRVYTHNHHLISLLVDLSWQLNGNLVLSHPIRELNTIRLIRQFYKQQKKSKNSIFVICAECSRLFTTLPFRIALAMTTTQLIPRSPENRGHKQKLCLDSVGILGARQDSFHNLIQIGRASCRERV